MFTALFPSDHLSPAGHRGTRWHPLTRAARYECQDSLIVGFFQVLSILPGISRSGSTITGGMVRNFKREPAARFSFLMSVPVMLAAGLLAALDLLEIPNLKDTIFGVLARVYCFCCRRLYRDPVAIKVSDQSFPIYLLNLLCCCGILTLLVGVYRG